jgi:hypothetical protein
LEQFLLAVEVQESERLAFFSEQTLQNIVIRATATENSNHMVQTLLLNLRKKKKKEKRTVRGMWLSLVGM